MVDKSLENPRLSTLSEALQQIEAIVPKDLRDRQFVGDYWEQIYALGDIPLDAVINTNNGFLKVKNFLAANLINVALQNWLSEAAFGTKYYPGQHSGVPMNKKECDFIIRTLAPQLVEFVKDSLGVFIRIDPEVNQPHVPLEQEAPAMPEITIEEVDAFLADHPVEIFVGSRIFANEIYIESQRAIASEIMKFATKNNINTSQKGVQIIVLLDRITDNTLQNIGGAKFKTCAATILFPLNPHGICHRTEILVSDDAVRAGDTGEA